MLQIPRRIYQSPDIFPTYSQRFKQFWISMFISLFRHEKTQWELLVVVEPIPRLRRGTSLRRSPNPKTFYYTLEVTPCHMVTIVH